MQENKQKHFVSVIRERIEELQELDEGAETARATVMLDQQSVGRLSRMDAIQQQAMAKASHARRKQEISALQQALVRIEEDEFGYCEDCGDETSEKRLAINPAIRKCIDCAKG